MRIHTYGVRRFRLGFTLNPITKDVSLKFSDEAVKQSIRNIILTNMEKPCSEFGGVKATLFENFKRCHLKGQLNLIRNLNLEPNFKIRS